MKKAIRLPKLRPAIIARSEGVAAARIARGPERTLRWALRSSDDAAYDKLPNGDCSYLLGGLAQATLTGRLLTHLPP
jgi:hypothetical protein